MNEEKTDGKNIERILWRAVRPALVKQLDEYERTRNAILLVRVDLKRTENVRSSVMINARSELSNMEQDLLDVLATSKIVLGDLAKACLRWDHTYARFVSINPWEGSHSYREGRYNSLKRSAKTAMQQVEYRLLRLEFE